MMENLCYNWSITELWLRKTPKEFSNLVTKLGYSVTTGDKIRVFCYYYPTDVLATMFIVSYICDE
jgi:hypothetical protein